MGSIVEKLAGEYDGKVDTDEEADLAEKFEVFTIPTLVFLKNGAEFGRKIGVTPEAALREFVSVGVMKSKSEKATGEDSAVYAAEYSARPRFMEKEAHL